MGLLSRRSNAPYHSESNKSLKAWKPSKLTMFENLREDWQIYERSLSRQGLWVMVVYRFGRWRYSLAPRIIRAPFSFLYKVLFVVIQILTGIELPCETTIGRRFRI